jgi:Fic family protein
VAELEKKLDLGFALNQKVLSLVASIDRYKGGWAGRERREGRVLKELRTMATIQSIGSSTRIEGATMTDGEVQKLLKSVKITRMKTRDEQEVAGYYETLALIYDNYGSIPLTESYILQLHGLLLKHSEKDSRHRGHYKQLSNEVVASYPDGSQRIIFRTTEPYLVEAEMRSLLDWAEQKFTDGSIHPLLVIALFIYEFLSIHPFQDGNGRLSRLLTTLCLLQQGYAFIQYISFENHIEEHKREYYHALMEGQRRRGKADECIAEWLLFFLGSLKNLTEKLDDKYERFKKTAGYLNKRQKAVFAFIKEKGPVKMADILSCFPGIPRGTIKTDLAAMRSDDLIIMAGSGRGSVYSADAGASPAPPA